MNIHQKILSESKHRVISGPFSSIKVNPRAVSWGDGDITRKLLGVYEEELNEVFEKIIRQNPKRIVNIGCAEGHYAVGLKVRCQNSQVFAIDVSDRALECVLINAELNKVHVHVGKNAPNPTMGDFWIIDIEGGEFQLLKSPEVWIGSSMLVEMHEWTNRNMCEIFRSKFEKTHRISIINQGSRNPNRFGFLSQFSDQERWSIMSENRPEMMRWMLFESN